MLINLNENYISEFVRKFALKRYGLHLYIYKIFFVWRNTIAVTKCSTSHALYSTNNQFLLNKTAIFQRVGVENSDIKYQK